MDVERAEPGPPTGSATAGTADGVTPTGTSPVTSHRVDAAPVDGGPDAGATRPLRQMAMVAGALYTSAGILVAGSLLAAGHLHRQPAIAWAVAIIGLAAGGAWLLASRWIDVPAWVHVPSSAGGSVLVGVLVVASGPTFAGVYGILLIYVVAFSFYFMAPRVAVAQTVLAAALYLAALWQVQEPGWLAHWLVVIGAAAVGAGLIAGLGHRTGELLRREQVAAGQLAQLNRVRDAFMRMVAHDLRTPLSTMLMNAQTVDAYLDDLSSAEVREMMGRQIAQGERLTRMVGDLLDTERLRSGAVRPSHRRVRLDELVRESVALSDTSGHHVELDLEPVEAAVDTTLLERAVDNLVANAVAHTPPGTGIAVRLRRDPDGIVLAVDDGGPGVPEGEKQTIFELFVHGSNTGGSTGIGLALVREVASAHGGHCWVQDRDGDGASFRLWLPEGPAHP